MYIYFFSYINMRVKYFYNQVIDCFVVINMHNEADILAVVCNISKSIV